MLEEVLLDIDEFDELLGAVIPCLAVGFVTLDIVIASVEFDFTECVLCCSHGIVCCLVAFPEVFGRCSV